METNRWFLTEGDRYAFDLNRCTSAKGWAQLDTEQDAWYFGNWINPTTLETMSYAEGDVTHHKAETVEEFGQEVVRTLRFYERAHIDDMMNPAIAAALSLVPGLEKTSDGHAWCAKVLLDGVE